MKIDDAIIDKVLNNKASAEDAKAVSEWLATEEGHDYLSKRIDREVSSLTENEVEDWVPHVIPEEKMQQRFLQQITLRRRVNSYRRWWAAAVLIPFFFVALSGFWQTRLVFFLKLNMRNWSFPVVNRCVLCCKTERLFN